MGAAVEKVQFDSVARSSQATQIEQSRAIAEVQAAVVVAQQIPRVVARSVAEMEESCKQPELAERAFFSFPRGGKSVQGPTVHLARELARCWGNVQYGIAELSRDRERSEMMAWAWDVQTNTRSSQTFIVPHQRDKRGGAEALTDMRDIYENNANQGARRVREAIFNMLPPWYTAKAEDLCRATLEHGGGKPLAQRVADAVAKFDALGVSAADLERSLDRPQSDWTAHDVTQLGIRWKSIDRGEASVADLFPREVVQAVTVADIKSQQEAPAPPADEPTEKMASDELRDEAKAAVTRAREAGHASDLAERLKALGLKSTVPARISEVDAQVILAQATAVLDG